MKSINRREAIKRTALIMGCTLSGSLVSAVLSGCSSSPEKNWKPSALSKRQLEAAGDLAEVILPETSTPGAKAAKTERFIDTMAAEWMSESEREILLQGLDKLTADGFNELSFEEQGLATKKMISDNNGNRFFRLFKQLTLLGFFTSEIGATEVLNYDAIPGVYSGCISLDEAGGKTWAT